MPTQAIITSAGRWLLGSGIHERVGGVARYYRTDIQENARISTEISGYAVSAMVYLNSITGEAAYLDRAVNIGRFLTRNAWDSSLEIFPFEYCLHEKQHQPLAYFFDSGIIARGLLSLWRATGDKEFLDVAAACGRSMAKDFEAGEREFHPILQLPSKAPLERDCRWSRSPGCYQLKAALAWLELFEQTGDQEFAALYERMLDTALCNYEQFLPGDPDPCRVMDRLHAYSYFLEGLIPVLDRKRCLSAAASGLSRAAALFRQIAPAFERSDVSAQLLRFRIFAEAAGAFSVDCLAAEEEANRLPAFQAEHFDLRIKGGFYFGRKGGEMLPYANPVSTVFALQALAMWYAHQKGQPAVARQMLI